jgi:26S proteasome regulatory subunit N7
MAGEKMDVDITASGGEKEASKSPGQPSGSAEMASKYPKMDLAQRIHKLHMIAGGKLEEDGAPLTEQVKKEILQELENPSLYRRVQVALGWPSVDTLDRLDKAHAEKLEELENKVEEAKESAGDMEVLEARVEIARFAAKSLPEEKAIEMYDKVLNLPKLSTGKIIDGLMECNRVASFYDDLKKGAELIERVSSMPPLLYLSH